MMLKLKFQYFGHLMRKSWLTGKDSDAGRDWGQEEKGTTEDEMAGWLHWLDGHEFEWTPGVGDGQGGLVCCKSWGRKKSGMTEQLDWGSWLGRAAPLGAMLCALGAWPYSCWALPSCSCCGPGHALVPYKAIISHCPLLSPPPKTLCPRVLHPWVKILPKIFFKHFQKAKLEFAINLMTTIYLHSISIVLGIISNGKMI